MTVAEAARALEVSPDLVYRLCRAGRLAHARIGLGRGVIRIAPADLDAFKASRKVEASDGPEETGPRPARRKPPDLPGIIDELLAKRRARRS